MVIFSIYAATRSIYMHVDCEIEHVKLRFNTSVSTPKKINPDRQWMKINKRVANDVMYIVVCQPPHSQTFWKFKHLNDCVYENTRRTSYA